MSLVCENLATKAELKELKDQLNALLGKKGDGSQINVLEQGDFTDTLIGSRLDLAYSAIQTIDVVDENQASVTTFAPSIIPLVGSGAITIAVKKGDQIVKVLKPLSGLLKAKAASLVKGLGLGKVGLAGAAFAGMSASSMVSLLLVVASLAHSIMTLQVLVTRIDQNQGQIDRLDGNIETAFNFASQNKLALQKNEKIAKENKKNIAKNEATLAEIKQYKLEIEKDIEVMEAAILKNNEMIDKTKLEVAKFKAEVEAHKEEVEEKFEEMSEVISTLEENLATTDENFDKLLVFTKKLGDQVADHEIKITELGLDLDRLKIQASINVGDMIVLKKELSDQKIISKSKINGLKAKLVLMEQQIGNIEESGTDYPFLPFPAVEQIADTQNKTLVLANTLAGNPVADDELAVSPSTVLKDNSFSKIFDKIVAGIDIGNVDIGDVNIKDLAVEISDLVTPNINTNIDTKFDEIGIPDIGIKLEEISNNTKPINLSKTVEKATSNAVCKSTQGNGCTLNNVTKPITKKVEDTAKNISDVLKELKDLLDNETLETVKDTNKKVNQEFENHVTEKTILAAIFAAVSQNAAMLSTEANDSIMKLFAGVWDDLKLKDYKGQDVYPQNWTKARLDEVENAENNNEDELYSQNKLFKIHPVVPERHQVRIGADRPQLIVIFKPKNKDYPSQKSRWSMSIPHPNITKVKQKDFAKLIPGYKKGSVQGLLTLTDNSKLTVNAKNQKEAENYIETLLSKGVVNSDFIPKDYFIKISINGKKLKELEVVPEMGKYFSTGQLNLEPDWILFFDK